MKTIMASELLNDELRNGVVLVDVWAPWCGPCRILGPQLEKLNESITEVTFVKINSDENTEYTVANNIRSVPTVIILKDGVEVDRFIGLKPMDEVLTLLKSHL